MTRCPFCSSPDLRLHGLQQQMTFEPRWGWFGGPPRLKTTLRAAEVSCAKCMWTFIMRPDGSTENTPLQNAHELLKRAQQNGDQVPAKGGADKVKIAPQPRPAPDPRSRRK